MTDELTESGEKGIGIIENVAIYCCLFGFSSFKGTLINF